MSSKAGELIAGVGQIPGVAAGSPHFKNALDDLIQGDLPAAERHIYGGDVGGLSGDNCFIQELQDKINYGAAADFNKAWMSAKKSGFSLGGVYQAMQYLEGEGP